MTTLSWWQGLILGLVQGLTEFLPVSSSGHLVLAERLVGFQAQGVFFEVAVHVATLLSVVIAYRRRIGELLRGLFGGGGDAWRYTGMLILASLPAGVAGVALRDYFERSFHSLPALGWQFLITAGLAVAFVTATISGIVAIRFLVSLLRHKKFHLFAPYCALLGAFCLVWFGVLGK